MNYKAIIFDMDGTIIDTDHIWKKATRTLLTSRGIDYTQEAENALQPHLHGAGLERSCSLLKETFNLKDPLHHLIQEKSRRAVEMYKEEARFIQGFVDFHTKVIKANLKSGVATNADDATVAATNKALDLEQFFGKHIYGISAVNNVGKPDPAIYLHAAQQLGIRPEDCIAIEDSSHGINAAKQAGMFCIGINTSKNRAAIAHSHLIIESYEELLLEKIIKK